MKAVKCDFCGSSEANLLVAQKDIVHHCAFPTQEFYLQKCNQCDLIYLSPQLEPEEISLYYPKDYEFYSDKKLWLCKAKTIIRDFLSFPHLNKLISLPFYLPYLRNIFVNLFQPRKANFIQSIKPCRLLDVGCGSGLSTHIWGHKTSLYSLCKNGFKAVGIEPSADARRIAGKYGLKVFSSLAELGNQEFDCIRMNWSLEHVDSPLKYFSAFRGLLKKGGKLVISVPNYSGILYKLFPYCVEIPVHNYYFTPETLEAYFLKFGFGILNKYSFSYPAMFVFAQKCLNGKIILNLNPWETIYFQSILDKFDFQMLGNDMVYLCQKKGD